MAVSASGGVLFFVNDTAGFDAARGSTTLAGFEDWESSTLAPNMSTLFSAPLEPGVANGPFPNGTVAATGMTAQINTSGGNPTVPTPGGVLATASAPFLGTPTDQVGPSPPDVSFDLLFGLPQTTAVSLTPLAIDLDASGDPGTVTIRVYDTSNDLLAAWSTCC